MDDLCDLPVILRGEQEDDHLIRRLARHLDPKGGTV
jgi:hypothetical protein